MMKSTFLARSNPESASRHERNAESRKGRKRGPQESELMVREVPEEMICPVCWEIFVQPVFIPCGHTFCLECIKKSIQEKKECPMCKEGLFCERGSDYKPNLLLSSMIDNLQVYCQYGMRWNERKQRWEAAGQQEQNSFCSAIIKRSLRSAHELECPYAIQRCDFWTLGCEVQIAKRFAEKHHKECPFPLFDRSKKENRDRFRSLENKIEHQEKQIQELSQQKKNLRETVSALFSFLQSNFPDSAELSELWETNRSFLEEHEASGEETKKQEKEVGETHRIDVPNELEGKEKMKQEKEEKKSFFMDSDEEKITFYKHIAESKKYSWTPSFPRIISFPNKMIIDIMLE